MPFQSLVFFPLLFRWLSQILKRANYSLKVTKTMDEIGKEGMVKKREEIKRNIQSLEEKSKLTIEDLKRGLQFEIGGLHKTTADVLRSRSMLNILTDWNKIECPPPDDSKRLGKEAAERIASKVASELNKWERENRIIHSIKDKMIKKFKRDCDLLEDQITEIEGKTISFYLKHIERTGVFVISLIIFEKTQKFPINLFVSIYYCKLCACHALVSNVFSTLLCFLAVNVRYT